MNSSRASSMEKYIVFRSYTFLSHAIGGFTAHFTNSSSFRSEENRIQNVRHFYLIFLNLRTCFLLFIAFLSLVFFCNTIIITKEEKKTYQQIFFLRFRNNKIRSEIYEKYESFCSDFVLF